MVLLLKVILLIWVLDRLKQDRVVLNLHSIQEV